MLDTKGWGRALKIMSKFLFVVAVIAAVFWAVWYAINGSVPVVSEIKITGEWAYVLPMAVPRWWDIVMTPALFVVGALGVFATSLLCERMDDSCPRYKANYGDVVPEALLSVFLVGIVMIPVAMAREAAILIIFVPIIELFAISIFIVTAGYNGFWKGLRDVVFLGLCSGMIIGLIIGPMHGAFFIALYMAINGAIVGALTTTVLIIYLIARGCSAWPVTKIKGWILSK